MNSSSSRVALYPLCPSLVGGFLAKSGFEQLESRLMLSVSQNSAGWTVVTPSADSRIIYVSSVHGNNANSGLSSSSPLATIAAATSLMRSGMPDEMLLERGDTFNDSFVSWNKSGRSAQEPMLIGTYGSGARPLINSGTAQAGFLTVSSTTANVSYLDIIGLQFYENHRDPNSSTYDLTAAGGGGGFEDYAPGGNILIEDSSFSFYRNNIDIEASNGPQSNITIRRSVSSYSWSTISHSQGIYAFQVNGLTVDQDVFDHNGWNPQVPGATQQGYNHDIYISSNCTNFVATNSIFANASFAGIMARAGGVITNNLFLNNAIAVAYGNANGADSAVGGVTGQLSGNVIVGDKSVGPLLYGQGFDIGNTNGVTVSNNIFTQDTQFAKDAIQLDMAVGTYNPDDAVGENNLTVSNNIVNGWYRGMNIDGRFNPGGTGLYGFNNVSITGNQFINDTNREFRQDGAIDPSEETLSGNSYYTSNLSPSNWFLLQSTTVSGSQWKSAYETTANILSKAPAYADPNRSAATYDQTVGGPGTLDDFMANADQLSDTSFRTQYMAQAMMDYVRAGFSLTGSVGTSTGNTPPTASASPSNVGASSLGASTYTFTVNYTDDFFLNAGTLDSNDILVTGPNGFSQLAVFVSAAAPTTGAGGVQSTIATYKFIPPGGSWNSSDDGKYTLTLRSNQVLDTTGVAAAGATVGNLTVDLTAPSATASVGSIDDSDTNDATYTFTITYSDLNGVKVSTLNNQEVEITGPGSYDVFATLTGTTSSNSGQTVTATYSANSPGANGWTSDADGTYNVSLASGQIKDNSGNAMAGGFLASFTAALSAPTPPSTDSVSGFVYNDANGNKTFDSRENPIAGVLVYADLNQNGKYDSNEPSATTDSNGQYTITGLADGQYILREQTPTGYVNNTGAQTVTLANGQNATMVNFANQITPVVNNGGGFPDIPRRAHRPKFWYF